MGAERGMTVSECNRLRTHERNAQVQVHWQSERERGGISVEGGVCGGMIDDGRIGQAGKQFIYPSNRPGTAEGSSIACTKTVSRDLITKVGKHILTPICIALQILSIAVLFPLLEREYAAEGREVAVKGSLEGTHALHCLHISRRLG